MVTVKCVVYLSLSATCRSRNVSSRLVRVEIYDDNVHIVKDYIIFCFLKGSIVSLTEMITENPQ